MSEIVDTVQQAVEHGRESRFNSVIAALVAVTATCMAVGNVKDGNIVQAMQQAQANGIDTWAYYQAKSTRQHLAESVADQLAIQRDTWPGMTLEARTEIDKRIAAYRVKAAQYENERAQLKAQADSYQREYDGLNLHDDQFDMSEAALSIAIALYGISALTRKRWLLLMASGLAAFGILLNVAGFAGWSIHPEFLAKWLS
jgi:hypothetical protein